MNEMLYTLLFFISLKSKLLLNILYTSLKVIGVFIEVFPGVTFEPG